MTFPDIAPPDPIAATLEVIVASDFKVIFPPEAKVPSVTVITPIILSAFPIVTDPEVLLMVKLFKTFEVPGTL